MRCTIAQLRISHWMRGPASPLTPYKTPKYTERDCLPKDMFCAKDDIMSSLPLISGPSLTSKTRQNIPTHVMQVSQYFPLNTTPTASSTHSSITHVTTHGSTVVPDTNQRTVHRRKKTAVSKLEQRLRVLNDPTNTVILPFPMPAKPGMKAKISSAGKKVVQTFLRHSSSRDVQ